MRMLSIRKVVILAIVLGCTCLGIAQATDFYVTTGGSDTTGDGSVGNPYATINKAVTQAGYTPGSTVFVDNGTYTVNSTLTLSKAGATGTLPSNSYNITALNGAAPILDFRGNGSGQGIKLSSNGWNIKGL